jgi:hopanoid biosynthesis associated protein HpnK
VKRLILNADDFGLTSGVNRAIAELSRAGTLTSTTLMAVAGATTEAAALAHELPQLGVGCHIVLVDGTPVLPPSELPTLVDPSTGRFRSSLARFISDAFRKRINPEEIEAEAEAQIARVRALGLTPTHIDTHKHTHMSPLVLKPLIAAAQRQGVCAIRNPFEPGWSLAATPGAPLLRRLQVHLLKRFEPAFRQLMAQSGLATPDGTIGVLATGTLGPSSLESFLRSLPEGTWELVTHPGYNDADLAKAGTRLLTARTLELEAIRNLRFAPEIELIHFGHLVPA